ncbi:MAG: hypothetical protein ACR2K1_10550, partial [Saprospiraceae bacterium]
AIALFDQEHRDTLRIDLWTKEMQVMEMDRFMYQMLRSLSQTYLRATQNKELAEEMAKFAHYFGEKTEILPKEYGRNRLFCSHYFVVSPWNNQLASAWRLEVTTRRC